METCGLGHGTEGLINLSAIKKFSKDICINPNDPQSISNNNISAICRGQPGYLWIGTAGGGLDLIDVKNEKYYAL